MSRATIVSEAGADYLAVTAFLPMPKRSPYLLGGAGRSAGATPVAWNEEAKCYIWTRRFPVSDLRDDRDIMDAILVTVDDAIGWMDLLTKLDLKPEAAEDTAVGHRSAKS